MAQGEILEKKGGTILGNRTVSQELIMLGNRIREYRKERGFSQEILAEKSGVSTNTISRIEGGQMAMSVGILQKIVKALGVDANTLLAIRQSLTTLFHIRLMWWIRIWRQLAFLIPFP